MYANHIVVNILGKIGKCTKFGFCQQRVLVFSGLEAFLCILVIFLVHFGFFHNNLEDFGTLCFFFLHFLVFFFVYLCFFFGT